MLANPAPVPLTGAPGWLRDARNDADARSHRDGTASTKPGIRAHESAPDAHSVGTQPCFDRLSTGLGDERSQGHRHDPKHQPGLIRLRHRANHRGIGGFLLCCNPAGLDGCAALAMTVMAQPAGVTVLPKPTPGPVFVGVPRVRFTPTFYRACGVH